ncbi:DNA polymerase/3'-5' exonuclease PolX [Legionella clemsonensis]|uniref:DNA polymerase/3'-5' exonuclease PolX n=1 Tax=Legionella clemsonensis TaxID=1867846 RepID=A0A222P174_9GAMM|nr:DNA polymerase/3'-5' exonuclease PolX [Legionella clemsonensis]ASQ45602.1 DNA polymerase/3'-5' exonuclease PolX [Legionella clemsonensis]
MEKSNIFIADCLYKIADVLEAGGHNIYRARSYRRAARTLLKLDTELTTLLQTGFDMTTLPWIGRGIASTILYIIETGELPKFKNQKDKRINELKDIHGLGKKRIAALNELNITTKKALLEAINTKALRHLRWVTPQFEEQLKKEINNPTSRKFIRLYHAYPIVEILICNLMKLPEIIHVECSGDFRRKKEVLEQIDLLVSTTDNFQVIHQFIQFKEVIDVLSQNDHHVSVNVWSGIKVNLIIVKESQFGAALLYYTGSREHFAALVKRATSHQCELTKDGLYKGSECISSNESDIYQQLNLSYIAPELREAHGEIEAAANNNLPKLITLEDIKGDLHSHTNETDGKDNLETMAKAAMEKGYEYLAITDHSKRLAITNGLDEKRLLKQIKEIDRLNSRLNHFLILKSIEVDILEDGSLDLSNEVLKELDIVVCSIHSQFKMPEEKQTERILRAMDNPYFNILGHATGRLIKSRPPYPINIKKIFKAAKDRNCIIELNAQPYRLDINDNYCRLAKEMNVTVAISSDSHSTRELGYMQFGIYQARRGWIEKENVINTRHWAEVKKLIKRS